MAFSQSVPFLVTFKALKVGVALIRGLSPCTALKQSVISKVILECWKSSQLFPSIVSVRLRKNGRPHWVQRNSVTSVKVVFTASGLDDCGSTDCATRLDGDKSWLFVLPSGIVAQPCQNRGI